MADTAKYEDFPFHLRSCVWELTLACCFKCAYCGSGGGTARENELTTEECLDVAGLLASLGCRRVSLIGGEIFLRAAAIGSGVCILIISRTRHCARRSTGSI